MTQYIAIYNACAVVALCSGFLAANAADLSLLHAAASGLILALGAMAPHSRTGSPFATACDMLTLGRCKSDQSVHFLISLLLPFVLIAGAIASGSTVLVRSYLFVLVAIVAMDGISLAGMLGRFASISGCIVCGSLEANGLTVVLTLAAMLGAVSMIAAYLAMTVGAALRPCQPGPETLNWLICLWPTMVVAVPVGLLGTSLVVAIISLLSGHGPETWWRPPGLGSAGILIDVSGVLLLVAGAFAARWLYRRNRRPPAEANSETATSSEEASACQEPHESLPQAAAWSAIKRRIMRTYLTARSHLGQRGLADHPSLSPTAFAHRSAGQAVGPSFRELTALFLRARYGHGEPDSCDADAACALAQRIEPDDSMPL